MELYASAHQSAPDRVYPLYWLATVHQESRDLIKAREYGERGLALDPNQIGLLLRLANIANEMRDPTTALEYYERAWRLDRTLPEIDALLADQLCYLGRITEGVAAFDRAIALQPDSLQLQQSRLFVLNYATVFTPAQLFEEHRAWGSRCEALAKRSSRVAIASNRAHTRLRIGYVSPDLRDHAVAYFVAPLFENHDRERFDIVCFDTSPSAEDWMTRRLRANVGEWLRVSDLSDDALEAAIRASRIDILLDLAGHTRFNRLPVFARKPAPVQATWLGYLNTTGLRTMDYRLTDAHMDPVGLTEALHTEKLFRLPVQACFAPSPDAPPVEGSPLAGGAPLTFGSVNQWPKVSAATKSLWSRVLVARPDSRLFVIARGGQNPKMQMAIKSDFTRHGARPEQIEVFPFMSTKDFLTLLGHVDIALDPSPYGGGTTTMQCLWMGVPVVAMSGTTALSRNSIGPLVEVGLDRLVAENQDQYVEAALRLSGDPREFIRLRAELRQTMTASRLMDAAGFARAIEAAYVDMWRAIGGAAGIASP